MISCSSGCKLLLWMVWLMLEIHGQPGYYQAGGTSCPAGCGQSTNCDTRCAPVTAGQTGVVLRWCNVINSNYECCCGCTTVVDSFTNNQAVYFWYNYDNGTCTSLCPPNYFSPGTAGYACLPCNSLCLTCYGLTNTQCNSCTTAAYKVNSNACYAFTTPQNPALTTNLNPCPNGYYGIQITKVCAVCPTGCSICAIDLTWQMPNAANFATTYNQNGINCTGNGDPLCAYTIGCYACSTGYTLINNWCIPNNQCFLYSYQSTSSGSSFSATNCLCFTGFQQLFPSYCTKCAINCLTCTGATSSSCSSCPAGASGSSCSYNSTYDTLSDWTTTMPPINSGGAWTTNVASPISGVNQKSCTSAVYVFGYYGYYNQGIYTIQSYAFGENMFPNGAKLSYSNTAAFTGKNHYGVHFRATLLFIDNWSTGMTILFTEGGINRFEFNYQMGGVVGEYLCGYNTHDHLDIVDDWFSHTADSLSLQIFATVNGYAWGIKQVLIQALLCHSSCASCTGPTSSDCVTCTDSTKQMVSGVCVCNSTAGFYMNLAGTACTSGCGTAIMNALLYSCVNACSFPNLFIYTNTSASNAKSCVINCPTGLYQMKSITNASLMTCVTNCYNTSISTITLNQFKFNGFTLVCFNVCPAGTYGDPITQSCVHECSKYNSSTVDGYFASGSYCYESCPSGWAYTPTRMCVSSCPTGYYKNYLMKGSTNSPICEEQCTVTLGGQYLYGDNTTGQCTNYCSTGSYGDIINNLCLEVCNYTSFGQTIAGQNLCVVNCSSAPPNNLYGNPLTGFCVLATNCPTSFYGDPLTFQCTTKCSGGVYFGENSTKMCITTACPIGFRQNDTKICVQTCLNNNSLLAPEWGDTTTGYCVTSCYGSMFGDPQQNMKCVATCAASPSPTFGLGNLCVVNCSNTTWADPFHTNRICTTSCTSSSSDSYGYNTTRTCVLNCPDGLFAHNVSSVPLCVTGCTASSGLFANVLNNRCQSQCPAPYYGDVTGNRYCLLLCPWPYYASNCTMSSSTIVISANRVCRLDCTSCGWADNSSQTCAWTSAGCQNGTFAHQSNHQCVVATACENFADPVTRYCIGPCLQNTSFIYFGDPSTKNCVLICPESPDLFGDNTTQTCNLTCSGTYVRDPQYLRRCVNLNGCSRTPLALYGDAVKALCVVALNCSNGYYGDNNTFICKAVCPGPTLLYADNVTRQCVAQCPLAWYALNVSAGKGVCSQYCPLGQWADNYTVMCTTRCSALTYGTNLTSNWTTFGTSNTVYGVCQTECPNGQFARDADNLCVINCGDGNFTNIWGDPTTKTCVTNSSNCPLGYYADDATHMCVVSQGCSSVGGVQYVADNQTKKCVNKCPAGVQNYADMLKYLCVAQCPTGFYGYNSTLKCVQECKYPTNTTYDGTYADPQLNICVAICSSTPKSLFGQNVNYTCVQARYCPTLTWAEVVVYNRQCVPRCAAPNTNNRSNAQQYADNLTFSCVTECPTYSYADLSTGYGNCVYFCPTTNGTLQFADNSTKACVTICPESQSTFGDNSTGSCVITCPNGSFAQTVPSRYCVAVCRTGTWGETVKNTCVTSPLHCPTVNGSIYYADDISTMCVKRCPEPTNSTAGSWGENTTRACRASCLLPSGQSGFMWNLTRVCIDVCPAEIGVDGSYSDLGMCYYVCMRANYYRDPQSNRSCQPTCSYSPVEQFADDTTYRCVSQCPSYPQQYYAYSLTQKCVATCPNNYRKLASNRSCVATCPNGTLFNIDTYTCVSICPLTASNNTQLFGDTTQSEAACVTNDYCPNNYYADTHVMLCVTTCSDEQWTYGKNCVQQCPPGYYGNPLNRSCVVPSNCPASYYADNVTVSCVTVCPGTFAFSNKTCLLVCPIISSVVYYADPVTRQCSTSCTYNASIQLIMNLGTQTCVSVCDPTLFFDPFQYSCKSSCSNKYYADNSTRTCVSICPATPPLFGENTTYTCVAECLNISQYQYLPGRVCVFPCPSGYFMENITRDCVKLCPNRTYADNTTGYCVSNCSTQFSYDGLNTCVTDCPSPYFADPTTYKCVFDCPNSPVPYFQIVQGTQRTCDTSCPSSKFRDYSNYVCTSNCPLSPITFADSTTGSCLSVCSSGYYAYLTTRVCMTPCPASMFADPNTRACVFQCKPTFGFFGDPYLPTPACVATCSPGSYADPYTQNCVQVCIAYPRMYAYYNGDAANPVRLCVLSCPYPWVANNITNVCYLQCGLATLPYLDLAAKSCVARCTSPVYQYAYLPLGLSTNGQCVKFCPKVGGITFYALLTNNSCVTKCPDGLYGWTENNTCMATCTLANNTYADPATNLCTLVCTNTINYFSYANLYTRTCVTTCPASLGLVGDRLIWMCVRRCSSLSQYADLVNGYCVGTCPQGYFADNTTQTCVANCSLYTLMYGDTDTRTCVSECLTTVLYADDTSRLCVASSSCGPGLFGFNTTRVCVAVCPTTPNLFGNPLTRICQPACPTSPSVYFKEPITRICVLTCPSIPAEYADNDTLTCVLFCPDGSYADNYTRYCAANCSIVIDETFADNSTNLCVKVCPTTPNYYASNYTWECVFNCPSSPPMYADNSTRSCVQFCPAGIVATYADDASRSCVKICPNTTFNQNSTRQCLGTCLTGFADPASKFCIAVCPNYSYGDNSTTSCVTHCPAVFGQQSYAEDSNNLCMFGCLANYSTFADPYTDRCVKICPISQGYFADPSTRTCVIQCPPDPLLFADFSTRTCVSTCPRVPSLFAINTSRVCTAVCPNNSWSDNITRTCRQVCITSPQTFGDNSTWSCVPSCPSYPITTYADSFTHFCVFQCPRIPDYYADNTTGKCVSNCPNGTYADPNSRRCVTTCPNGTFGLNSTLRCVTNCPNSSFADVLKNLCVHQCTVDPIYYGNPDTWRCVAQCPSGNNSFGNPLTQQCVKFQPNGTSGCTAPYFSDEFTRLCVQVCPMKRDTYGDNSTWKCVAQCPAGSNNTFADNSTMRCVKVCPTYPEYYAQPYSRRCVQFCLAPNDSFTGSFSDNSTRTCTQVCPPSPDYYSDNSTGRCVFYCPRYFDGNVTYADYSTRRCVDVCPQVPDIYGDNYTQRCVLGCPVNQSTFADPTTRLCVMTCPSVPPLYADNSTQRCLSACPNNSYADNATRRCLAVCPRYPQTYGAPFPINSCVSTCPSSPSLFADPNSQQCIIQCNEGYFAQNTTRRCLQQCPYNLTNYADNFTRRCVSLCPASQATYGDNQTQRCVSQCPLDPFTYADNITQTCLGICINTTNGGYADNYSRICVINCPADSFADITTRYCVRYCPVGWYAYTVNNTCVANCPTPYFADNSTWDCVQVCPVGQNLFGETINNTCVPVCPQGTYASEENQQCVTRCPNSSQTIRQYNTFGENTSRTCMDECPVPLYGYPVAQVCVNICPHPYYQNITDHLCYRCPQECASCTAPYSCLTCVPLHYLYSGTCVQSCPTFPVITYANPNLVCGTATQCTQGYYALNATKSCVSTCPAGHFVNIVAQTCDACMKGCVSCTSYSSCLACNIQMAIWSNYTCYVFCSITRKYYTSMGCVATCPNGTYLSLTTCKACSSLCQTCVVTAQSCLICANGYYISNGICVSQCPTNTIARMVNGSQTCVSCTSTICRTAPLTFKTTQFSNNFKYTVQIQFSQPVNIMKEIDKVIQLQQTNTKRLLSLGDQFYQDSFNRMMATSYQYLDYTIIQHGNGLYSFVLNNYNPASGSQVQVQILNPSAIVTASGQMPQTTRSSLTVDTSSLYTLQSYNQSISGYLTAVAVFAFILLLFTFGVQHSIWMPMFDLLQLLMSIILINVVFPPNLLYSVKSCFISAFTFLPNFFSSSYSQAPFSNTDNNNNIYSLIQDGSFLRVVGPIYFILVMLVVVWLVVLLLSKKSPNKEVKKWSKNFIKQIFWKKHLHGLVYLFFFPVMMFGIYNMGIYSYLGTSSIQIFSILSSFIFMILFVGVVIFFAYKLRKLAKDYPIAYLMIQKAYNFIAYQKTVLVQNKFNYFTFEKNDVDLTNARQPRINELLIFPYPIETKTGPMQISFPLISYMHKFLTAVFLAISFNNPVIQVVLLILVNIAFMVYLITKKPFFRVGKRQFNNQMYIHNLIVITLIDVVMLIFVFMNSQLAIDPKVLIGNFVCGLMLYVATVNLIYLFYRTYNYYHHHVWKQFVRSDTFKLNYIIQHLEWTKQYEKEQKKLMSEVKPRSEFLEAIQVETGESLANMVMRAPSISTSTKDKMKALQLRPNKANMLSQQYGQIFTQITGEKEKSHKSIASSERLSKAQRKKVRDTIFGQKEMKGKEVDDYKKLQLIDEKNELEMSEPAEVSQNIDLDTEYQFEFVEEQYPEGTPMEEIMKGCSKGDVELPM